MLGGGTPGLLHLLLLIGTSLLVCQSCPGPLLMAPGHVPPRCSLARDPVPWLEQTSLNPCCNCVGGCVVCCCGRIHFVEGVPESGALLAVGVGSHGEDGRACRQPAMAPLVTMAPTRSLLHAIPGRTLHNGTFVGSSMECRSAGISFCMLRCCWRCCVWLCFQAGALPGLPLLQALTKDR